MNRALILSLSLLAIAGCSQPQGPANEAPSGNDAMGANEIGADDALNAAAATGEAANNAALHAMISAQQFVDDASASDAYEIAAAKLAQQKASAQAVKGFAASMIQDHTQSTAQLKAAASKVASHPVPTGGMSAEQQAQLTALKGATGSQFDTLYVSQQIDAHAKALASLQSYAQNGDAPLLRDFAGKSVPIVQSHLEMARQLGQQLVPPQQGG